MTKQKTMTLQQHIDKTLKEFDVIFNSVIGVKHFHPEIEDELKQFLQTSIINTAKLMGAETKVGDISICSRHQKTNINCNICSSTYQWNCVVDTQERKITNFLGE